MSRPVSRRDFLKTSAVSVAALAAGCDSKPETKKTLAEEYQASNNPTDSQNLYNLLKTVPFVNQDGEPLNVDALKTKLQNKFATLTFGFGSCDQTCPTTNANLGKVGEMSPDVVSIIISVQPGKDNASAESREAYKAGVKARGMKQETIILYAGSSQEVQDLQLAMGGLVNPANPRAHDANVLLYAPGGRQIGKIFGMSDFSKFKDEWGPILDGSTIKR